MALGEKCSVTGVAVAQSRIFEPGDRFSEVGDASVNQACLDFPVPANALRHYDVIGHRLERQRFLAILQSSLGLALSNVGRTRAPQTDNPNPDILKSSTVVEGTAAVICTRPPVAEH